MNSVACILILLWTANFLSSFGHEDSELLRSKDFLISSNKLSVSDLEHHGRVTESENYNVTEKAQRGRGASGGGSLVHRRPAKSPAPLHRPCLFISSTIFGFSFFLLIAYHEE